MSKTRGICALQQNKNDCQLTWNCMLYHGISPLICIWIQQGFNGWLSMAPPKDHAVGDSLIVAKLRFIWFICCILMEKTEK